MAKKPDFVFPDSSYVRFTVNKDADGKVNGFTMKGISTEAEAFCVSFITAQSMGKGTITFQDGKIVFHHSGVNWHERNEDYNIWGVSKGGVFSADIDNEDARELSRLLERQGEYKNFNLHVSLELAFGRGFTLEGRPKK